MSMIAPAVATATAPVAEGVRGSSIANGYVDVGTWAKRKQSRKKKNKKRKKASDVVA
jgi:hypothetical protein